MPRVTENIGLKIPDVGEPSPQWTQEIRESFDALDAHNHSTSGVKLDQNALSFNGPLSLDGQHLASVAAVQLTPRQLAPLGAGLLFVDQAGNLYFRSSTDQPVQITAGGGVAGSGGSITGDFSSSGAAVYYDGGLKRYRLLDQDAATADVEGRNAFFARAQFTPTTGLTGPRSLYSEDGQLVYRDGNDIAITLTSNGHGAGGDIRGQYASAGAEVYYDDSDKRYTFKDATLTQADVEAKAVRADQFVYRIPTVRRIYTNTQRCTIIRGASFHEASIAARLLIGASGNSLSQIPMSVPSSLSSSDAVRIKALGFSASISSFPSGSGPMISIYRFRSLSIAGQGLDELATFFLWAGQPNVSANQAIPGWWDGNLVFAPNTVQMMVGDTLCARVSTVDAPNAQIEIRSLWADVTIDEADTYTI